MDDSDFMDERIPLDEHTEDMFCWIGYLSIREEWDYWAGKTKLLAYEAIPLMHGVDPQSWKECIGGKKGLPDDMVHSIERYLELAKCEGLDACSPTEWLAWGRVHGLDKYKIKPNYTLVTDEVGMWHLFESAVNAYVILHVDLGNSSAIASLPQQEAGKTSNEQAFMADDSMKHMSDKKPHNSIGRAALEVAREIEKETGQKATHIDVMLRLKDYAENGEKYSDVLRKDGNNKLIWLTTSGEEKIYSKDACRKMLNRYYYVTKN